jgi:hypothetical protein
MSIDTLRSPPLPRRQRIAAIVAAVAVSGAIVSTIVLSFGTASPDVWLAPTPEVMELASGCDRQPTRAERDRCKQQIVTARLARERQPVAVAEAKPDEPDR